MNQFDLRFEFIFFIQFVIGFILYSFLTCFFQDECQIGIEYGGEDFLFGSTFFNQATVIFDRDNDRVGLTPK